MNGQIAVVLAAKTLGLDEDKLRAALFAGEIEGMTGSPGLANSNGLAVVRIESLLKWLGAADSAELRSRLLSASGPRWG